MLIEDWLNKKKYKSIYDDLRVVLCELEIICYRNSKEFQLTQNYEIIKCKCIETKSD